MSAADQQLKAVGREPALAQIAKHPLRVACFMVLAERVASPIELSRQFNAPVGQVSHHVRKVLYEELGAIEIVGEKPRRGAIEHFYRAIERPLLDDEEWERLPETERRIISYDVLNRSIADISHSWEAGVFDRRTDRALIRYPMTLDEIGWRKMNELHGGTLYSAFRIQAEANARMAESGETGMAATHFSAFFERGSIPPPVPRVGESS